jgi:signal peptidase II
VGVRKSWARAGLVLAGVLALDQATKALVRHGLAVGDRDPILPGVELVHVRNDGVAFGVLAGGGVLVAIVIGAAIAGLLVYFATHADKPLIWLPTGMLAGGALGNIIDRARDGSVTDFIKLPLWPAFNVADMAITFGVLLLLYVIERPASEDGEDGDGADGGR